MLMKNERKSQNAKKVLPYTMAPYANGHIHIGHALNKI